MSGFHVLPGEGSGSVLNYTHDYQTIKGLTDSFHIVAQAKAKNPNLITVCRTLQTRYGMLDYPQDWNWESPEVWWSSIKDYLPKDCDYYEVINESSVPPQGFGYWAQWHIEMAQYVERDTDGLLLAFSFAAGTPEIEQWEELLPYIRWAENNPVNGKYHGIAFHAAPNATFTRSGMPWINDPFLTVERVFVKVGEAYGLQASLITVAVTEWGLSGGYSGNWTAEYSCAEAADAYKTTVQTVLNVKWQGLVFLNWWNIGKISIWESDDTCIGEMVR